MTITAKMLKAFLTSEAKDLKGVGFNYGLTHIQASRIRKAVVEEYGMRCFWPKTLSLDRINKRLSDVP